MTVMVWLSVAIFGGLGVMHLAYTLRDFGPHPRHFRPTEMDLLARLRSTRTAIAPHGRDYWSGILGFHLSHSTGLLLFALLIAVTNSHSISWLKPLLIIVGVSYVAIAWRCWFQAPMMCSATATALMAVGWML